MKRLTIPCLAFILAGCSTPSTSDTTENVAPAPEGPEAAFISKRERAVIQAMFDYETQGVKESRPIIVLSALSSVHLLMDGLGEDAASERIDVSAIRDFRRANSSGHVWPKDLDSRYDLRFLTSAQSKEIWRDRDGWNRFYRMFPKARGHTTISRAGFSADGKLALVYRGCQSDWLAGSGQIHVLRFEHGKWRVTSEHIGGMWISTRSSHEPRTGELALQTIPMTRSVYEKPIEFGSPQRGAELFGISVLTPAQFLSILPTP